MEDELLVLDRVAPDEAGDLAAMEASYRADLETVDPPTGEPARQLDDEPAAQPGCPDHTAAEDDAALGQIVEALLLAADTPLSAARLAELIEGGTPTRIRLCIEQLNECYAQTRRSFRIEAIAGGYQMMTLPRFEPWLVRLNKQRAQTRLSPAALETLSIVAYKQPVIRAEIEAIRGVACGEVLSRLRELGLVKIVGRAEVVGRPLLYATTRKFLDVFGLADLEDLPPLEALTLRPTTRTPEAAAEPSAEAPVAATA